MQDLARFAQPLRRVETKVARGSGEKSCSRVGVFARSALSPGRRVGADDVLHLEGIYAAVNRLCAADEPVPTWQNSRLGTSAHTVLSALRPGKKSTAGLVPPFVRLCAGSQLGDQHDVRG